MYIDCGMPEESSVNGGMLVEFSVDGPNTFKNVKYIV